VNTRARALYVHLCPINQPLVNTAAPALHICGWVQATVPALLLLSAPTLFSSMQARSCSPDGHSITKGSLGDSGVTNLSVTVGSAAATVLCWGLNLLQGRGTQLADGCGCLEVRLDVVMRELPANMVVEVLWTRVWTS
jgi:hypothetical protein